DFTYPADFRVPELSRKTAQFEICLHPVERKQVPPVADALAKSLGYADLEALRAAPRSGSRLPYPAAPPR
ncbi:trigger factor, partial [Faecalibacterium prausnitzii]|nr:trigger factor [Faecalibacterium prausnitzii]